MTIKINCLVAGLCAVLFALALSVDAQQPGKIFRIGYPGWKHCFR